jgi:predicted secreted hydrolase
MNGRSRVGRPPDARRTRIGRLGLLPVLAVVLAACSGGPILANVPVEIPPPPATPAPPPATADPIPIELPRDDGPHRRLTEWWYYTGHLRDDVGGRYGFEYVIFRAERGSFPVSWASHLAITDETNDRFVYAQRAEIGPQVDRSPRVDGGPVGFDLSLRGLDPTRPETFAQPAWSMAGALGRDRLSASLSAAEAAGAGVPGGMALDLELSTDLPPALHDTDGWIDFGRAGGSYYYSRTRMEASGTIVLDGRELAVTGSAWFDHQWGDFIAVGGGGWDWFAVNLDDRTDITISLVRDADGSYPLIYGTLVEPDGGTRHLGRDEISVEVMDRWTSPRSGATYPAGWRIVLPGEKLVISLRPTVSDQELDTRETTGVIYWEGSQVVSATRDGRPLGGEAYVELTGYATRSVATGGP